MQPHRFTSMFTRYITQTLTSSRSRLYCTLFAISYPYLSIGVSASVCAMGEFLRLPFMYISSGAPSHVRPYGSCTTFGGSVGQDRIYICIANSRIDNPYFHLGYDLISSFPM